MATGNQVLPGAPATAERAVTAEPAQQWLRRGAGGRWLVWALRGVAWLVVLLVGYRGVLAIIAGPSARPAPARIPAATPARLAPARPSPAVGASGDYGFPAALAGAYALEFGQVYLGVSPAGAARRAASLASFLPPGADPGLGWNGAGTVTVQSVQVAGISVRDAHDAVVTLLARINGHLIELGVPVYAARGSLVVSGQPALLPAPASVTPPAGLDSTAGRPASAAMRSFLAGFFRAFASGRGLGAYLGPGVHLTGLGGAVTLGRVVRVLVPAAGPAGSVRVTVAWLAGSGTGRAAASGRSGPARITMTYALTLVRLGGSWDVRSIGAATP